MTNIPLVLTFVILGLCVLLSYIPLVKDVMKNGGDRYWYMAPRQRILYYIMIPLSALGMIFFIYHYSTSKASTGLLRKKYVVEILTALFLIASAAWSLTLVAYNSSQSGNASQKLALKIACSTSLVIAAIATILMLAGCYEDDTSPPLIRVSVLVLCVTTVLNDAIGWNSRFILNSP